MVGTRRLGTMRQNCSRHGPIPQRQRPRLEIAPSRSLAAYSLPATQIHQALGPPLRRHPFQQRRRRLRRTDLWSSFQKLETAEPIAHIALVAEQPGGPNLLDRQEVDELFKARARYGIQSNSKALPGRDKIAITREELITLMDESRPRRALTPSQVVPQKVD